MAQMFFKIADSVFQTLKGFGYTLTLFDTAGQKVLEPSLARRIFCDPDKFMVSINELGPNSEIKVYLSDSFDIKENSNLIQTLRSIANHWNLLFSIKKYGKQLEPKMFAFMATPIREGYKGDWYGSTRSSYRKCYDSKIIIRHSGRLHLEEHEFVDRKSQVKKIYLETAKGERLLVPGNSFALARGMAAYFASGGRPIDMGFRQLCQIHETYAQLKTCRKKIALENELRPVVEGLINEFSKSIKHSFNKNKINDILESFAWIQRVSDNKKAIENVNNAEDYVKGLMEMKESLGSNSMGKKIYKKMFTMHGRDADPKEIAKRVRNADNDFLIWCANQEVSPKLNNPASIQTALAKRELDRRGVDYKNTKVDEMKANIVESMDSKFVLGIPPNMDFDAWEDAISDFPMREDIRLEFWAQDRDGEWKPTRDASLAERAPFYADAVATVTKTNGQKDSVWVGHFTNTAVDEEAQRAAMNSQKSNSYVNAVGRPIEFEMTMNEADRDRMARGGHNTTRHESMLSESDDSKFILGSNNSSKVLIDDVDTWEDSVISLGIPNTYLEFETYDQDGGLHPRQPGNPDYDSYFVNAMAKVAKKNGGFAYLWLGYYVNNSDMEAEAVKAYQTSKTKNVFVDTTGNPVKMEDLNVQMNEADGVKLRRGWEIDPETGEPKFVGSKRDRDRMARGEAPRDARLRGTLPVKLEPREKKKDPSKDLPVTPKALEIQKFLTDVYNITGGGDVSDDEMLNQAKRITAGQIKLVNPATMERPKMADSADGKMAKMVWNLSEISQRLGVHDLVLANILSRVADAFETEMSGEAATFNPKDSRVVQLVKFVTTKFKNDIMEKTQSTFPEMVALTEWFDKFAPKNVFETKKKGR
jgi:hypothetical protein